MLVLLVLGDTEDGLGNVLILLRHLDIAIIDGGDASGPGSFRGEGAAFASGAGANRILGASLLGAALLLSLLLPIKLLVRPVQAEGGQFLLIPLDALLTS